MDYQIQIKLAAQQYEKKSLILKLQQFIEQLQDEIKQQWQDIKIVEANKVKIDRLKQRIQLIHSCNQYSFLRLSHLQQIFKYYCIHVFRIGKHMTFDRLQYDRVHMTMERFFLFLRDFQLMTAVIDGKNRQVIEKNSIITMFKKISSNCSHLSFEQFIQCIQKLGIVYWNERQNFHKKQKQLQLQKQNRKKLIEKRNLKKKGLIKQNSQNNDDESDNQQENEEQQAAQEKNEQKQKEKSEQIHQNNNQNDGMVNDLINDKDIQDPNDEVNSIANNAKRQNQMIKQNMKAKEDLRKALLTLTMQEKIQNYYKILNIDSFNSYRNKVTSLNMPLYQYKQKKMPVKQNKVITQSKIQQFKAEEERLKKLKEKLNEKSQKLKQKPLPKPSNQQALKQQQNSRKRKQKKKQRQNAVKEIKTIQAEKLAVKQKVIPLKYQYKESEVSWDIFKLNLEQLKLKQFNPTRLYSAHEDDAQFMNQYGSKSINSNRLQARQRQSMSVVESTKNRAQQLMKKQLETEAFGKITDAKKSIPRNKI